MYNSTSSTILSINVKFSKSKSLSDDIVILYSFSISTISDTSLTKSRHSLMLNSLLGISILGNISLPD